jgi:microcystin-dependent protein
MSEWFLGEIRVWACNFAPSGWSKCEGQELPVNQYAALFSLIGNSFGGKAGTTFCLPDLRGRTITSYDAANPKAVVGTPIGVENFTLVNDNVAAHTHTINANNNPMPNPATAQAAIGCTASAAAKPTPVGYVYGNGGRDARYKAITPDSEMRPGMATIGGSTQVNGGGAHNNMAPFLPLVYCIAMAGVYPTRG